MVEIFTSDTRWGDIGENSSKLLWLNVNSIGTLSIARKLKVLTKMQETKDLADLNTWIQLDLKNLLPIISRFYAMNDNVSFKDFDV